MYEWGRFSWFGKRKLLKNKGWARTALGFPSGSAVQNLTAIQEPWAPSLIWEDPLEKEIAIHSSVLAWNIPWTHEFSRLQSVGSQRVRCTHIGHLHQLGSTDLKDSSMRSLGIHLFASQHLIQNLGTLIPTLVLCSSSRPSALVSKAILSAQDLLLLLLEQFLGVPQPAPS